MKKMYKVMTQHMRTPVFSMFMEPDKWYREANIDTSDRALCRGIHACPLEGVFFHLAPHLDVWECLVDGKEALIGPVFSRFERLKLVKKLPRTELKERCMEWKGPFNLTKLLLPFDNLPVEPPNIEEDIPKWRQFLYSDKPVLVPVFESEINKATDKLGALFAWNAKDAAATTNEHTKEALLEMCYYIFRVHPFNIGNEVTFLLPSLLAFVLSLIIKPHPTIQMGANLLQYSIVVLTHPNTTWNLLALL